MKKFMVMAALLLMGVSTVSAQRFGEMFGKNKKGDVTFGVRAGVNFSDLTFKYNDIVYDYEARTGFQLGGIVDIPLFNGFYIQPGLFVTSRGATLDSGENHETVASPIYLAVPVLASFRGDVCDWCNLQFNVGPYLGVGLGGRYKFKHAGEPTVKHDFFGSNPKTGDFEIDDYVGDNSRFDMGFSFGVGATFIKHWYVGFQYDLGLVDIDKSTGAKVHNGNFAIQVGYNF